jgi:hypothetical protein
MTKVQETPLLSCKGMVFDDWNVFEGKVWSQVCESHAKNKCLDESWVDDNGSGICGVIGCECEDSTTYVDFHSEDVFLVNNLAIKQYVVTSPTVSEEDVEAVKKLLTVPSSAVFLVDDKNDSPVGLRITQKVDGISVKKDFNFGGV